MTGAGDEGGTGDSRGEEHEEVLSEAMAWAGRMGERVTLQNGPGSGTERLRNGVERTGAKFGTMGARIGTDSSPEALG